jgi:hypothetical protein
VRRSLDWKRHWLLAAALAAAAGVLVLEVGEAFVAAAVLALALLLMSRLGWLRGRRRAQTVCLRVPPDFEYEHVLDGVFRPYAEEADLVEVHSPGPCIDLQYAVRLRRGRSADGLLDSLEGLVVEARPAPGES